MQCSNAEKSKLCGKEPQISLAKQTESCTTLTAWTINSKWMCTWRESIASRSRRSDSFMCRFIEFCVRQFSADTDRSERVSGQERERKNINWNDRISVCSLLPLPIHSIHHCFIVHAGSWHYPLICNSFRIVLYSWNVWRFALFTFARAKFSYCLMISYASGMLEFESSAVRASTQPNLIFEPPTFIA